MAMATRAEVGELIGKIFDRLEQEFPGATVNDALILVELSDPEDIVVADGDGHDVPATIVLLECTTDRAVVQEGLISFAMRTVSGE